jgi:polysaccharide biosynthesis transport protein
MSQVMENPPIIGAVVNNSQGRDLVLAGDQQQGFDILKVLWRWKWLPILGAMIGTGVGYLYFSKQPAEFQATALVQVVSTVPPATRIQQYESPEMVLTRNDESMVIKSQRVLKMAVEKGRLTDQAALRGQSADMIAGMLSGKALIVQPAAKDANTTLIQISYICNDAELAAAVVNAVVDGYSDYLNAEFNSNGSEIYELVKSAQDKLAKTYKDLNAKNDDFRKNFPDVVWTGDEVNDPYAERYKSINAELSALQSKRQLLGGTLKHVEIARKADRSAEALLLMLSADAERHIADDLFTTANASGQAAARRIETAKLETESARLERTALFELEGRERRLASTLGENHPAVSDLRQQISITREHIARLAQSEKMELARMEQLQKEAEEAAKKEIKVEGVSVEQRLAVREQAMKEHYASIELQIQGLNELAQDNLKRSKEHQTVASQNRLLNSELASVQTLLDAYTEKLKSIELLPAAGQRSLKELNLPSSGYFYGPKLAPYLLGGAAIGFLLLSGLAVLMDLADHSYRNPDEIAKDLNMPVLGHVPVMDLSKVKKKIEACDGSLTTIHHNRGQVSEAYRAVRTGLFFSNRGGELKVIQVTSPVPGDGKSTLSSNLAVTMAQSGRRVLLIDADFRRPRIAKIFGIDADVGMAAVVAERAELDDAIYSSPVPNLSIMPGGKRPSNPAELLSSRRFKHLIDLLREKFDVIIIDTPPLLAVSDPGAVAAIVDGVVLTMRLRRNVKPLATRATKILESVDARLLGVVVNGVSSEAGYGYSYGYNDYRYAYRYGSNYRYGYGSKYGYGGRYGAYSAGYIEEPHDVEQTPPPAKDV